MLGHECCAATIESIRPVVAALATPPSACLRPAKASVPAREADARIRTADPFITSHGSDDLRRPQMACSCGKWIALERPKSGFSRPLLDTNLTHHHFIRLEGVGGTLPSGGRSDPPWNSSLLLWSLRIGSQTTWHVLDAHPAVPTFGGSSPRRGTRPRKMGGESGSRDVIGVDAQTGGRLRGSPRAKLGAEIGALLELDQANDPITVDTLPPRRGSRRPNRR
jgi:hypothetical protein